MRNSDLLKSRIVGLVIFLFSLAGCINTETVVHLNADGTGQIVEKTLMSKQFVEQMASIIKGMGDQLGRDSTDSATGKGLDLFSEDKARKRAAQLGEGVSFVSSKKISDADWEGVESIYAFRDIRKVHLSERHQPSATAEGDSPEGDKGRQTTFGFSRLPNGNSLLTVLTPPLEKKEKLEEEPEEKENEDSTDPPVSSNPKPDTEAFKKMFEGFRIMSAIDVQGTIVKTTIPYQTGSRLTLLEIDFSQLLGNEAMLKELQALKPKTLEEAKVLLKEVKGIKIPLDSKMLVEFRGK